MFFPIILLKSAVHFSTESVVRLKKKNKLKLSKFHNRENHNATKNT
ncbi:hypothetical protein HMPREF9996_01889 [Aggregatibacter actinomycetemcomitans Y4]|nr:hypothetical protein HMPREF9996_01889 [Aggregatibacter actinomycetemcomitans Y4]